MATVAVDLLRNEYALNGVTTVPDSILAEIVDQVFLPLVRAHGSADSPRPAPARRRPHHLTKPCSSRRPQRLIDVGDQASLAPLLDHPQSCA
ncbi:hypothetical protein [Nonomuraea sp. 10N515B]|uniref:hypothetical protein n=1 Tax=Nonomuraea sp. 10N515B TaxID=3457422 RepID=UPI003FCD890C